MKKIQITFAVLCTLLSSFIYSQNYYPLPETNTHWKYLFYDIPMFCGCWGLCGKEQLKISGDTIINNLTYHKIEHSGIFISNNCDETFFSEGYKGAFRNDIENKKVWFIPANEGTESLLYDFSLEIGDMLEPGILNPNEYWDFWVEDIEYVQVGSSLRKKFLINSELNIGEGLFEIIEGIGGQNLIAPFEAWMYFEAGYWLDCVNISDSIVYPSGGCELIVNDNETKQKDPFQIFPNPSDGMFWIKNASADNDRMMVNIFNSTGRKILSIQPLAKLIPIDLANYPKGVYFIQINISHQIHSQKIILE